MEAVYQCLSVFDQWKLSAPSVICKWKLLEEARVHQDYCAERTLPTSRGGEVPWPPRDASWPQEELPRICFFSINSYWLTSTADPSPRISHIQPLWSAGQLGCLLAYRFSSSLGLSGMRYDIPKRGYARSQCLVSLLHSFLQLPPPVFDNPVVRKIWYAQLSFSAQEIVSAYHHDLPLLNPKRTSSLLC